MNVGKIVMIAAFNLFTTHITTIAAYCSCKCDGPIIPYTKVAYAPMPYKYLLTTANPHVPSELVNTNHQQLNINQNHFASPVLPVPHLTDQCGHTFHSNTQESYKDTHSIAVHESQNDVPSSFSSNQIIPNVQHEPIRPNVLEYTKVAQQVHEKNIDGKYEDDGTTSDAYKKKKNHHIHYKFEYSVNSHKTGDIKRHKEERKGDDVTGEYSLVEENGNVRTVKYRADWETGFHAQVFNTKPTQG